MAESVVPSIISGVILKLLGYLGRLAVEKIAPYFGGISKLNGLKNTMRMIQARLSDAERRGEGGDGEAVIRELLTRLKRVLYRLEDLLEEVNIGDKEEIGKTPTRQGNPLLKCSCVPFSWRSSHLVTNKLVADEAKVIMEELAAIQSDMACLNLISAHLLGKPLLDHRDTYSRDTYSFVIEEEVIGRDDDKRAILELIFHSDHDVGENISVIPIVGIGGLGKTTLAQLVFNDKNVQNHFELKIWACISEISSLNGLLEKILQSIPGESCHRLGIELRQTRLREIVRDKKYLLVLDDLWDEDRERWLKLKRLLCGCKQGSKIIVTSRSKVVAQNMGTVDSYDLGVLAEDKSWVLFRRLAFKVGQEENNPNLTSIGREIVKKCANLPLAIRTIAGLLYSKDTVKEWECLRDVELRTVKPDGNIIMSTLKLSYDHLPSHLKQCFAYCSLFPKDYGFVEKDLIQLWMAQGFIGLSNGNQAPEDVGHGYFMELLRRSFFQDVERIDYDNKIIHCKMHDLVHDLAQDVAGGEILLVDGPTQKIDDDVLHVGISAESSWKVPSTLLASKQSLRSLISVSVFNEVKLNIDETFLNLRRIRALDLYGRYYKSLPNSIGELKHLRYLRLGGASLEALPNSITRLRNLQTLDIRLCDKLRKLPSSFSNLISLRHLYIPMNELIDLPPRFGQLTSLKELNTFIVGEHNGFDALASLKNLAGVLSIRFVKQCRNAAPKINVGLLKETNLTDLGLVWSEEQGEEHGMDKEDTEVAYLACLQPPPSLKKLTVHNWKEVEFPIWGMDDELRSSFPYLFNIEITDCRSCKHLPPLSRLPLLRDLRLKGLRALEYVEIGGSIGNNEAASSRAPYFPSLERLELKDLPELKIWLRVGGQDQDIDGKWWLFPRLLELEIYDCPELMSMPLVPKLRKLATTRVHGKLVKRLLCDDDRKSPSTTLMELAIESVSGLDSLSINLSSLESLRIVHCPELVNLILESPISLHRLLIDKCGRLREISGALQHLSVLESLMIRGCEELDLGNDDDDDEEADHSSSAMSASSSSSSSSLASAWRELTSLRSLYLSYISNLPRGLVCLQMLRRLSIVGCPNLRALPEEIGHLTQLCRLQIWGCPQLSALPKSIQNLIALQELDIAGCPEIKRRCKEPEGEDCPLIRHIPRVNMRDWSSL